MCKMFFSLTAVNWFASVFTLTVLSADRYLAVCHAIDSRRYRTTSGAQVVCVCIWVASLVAMFPVYIGARTVVSVFDENGTITTASAADVNASSGLVSAVSCTLQWPENRLFSTEYAFMWCVVKRSTIIMFSLSSTSLDRVVV